mgnify:CR=1 FL=1
MSEEEKEAIEYLDNLDFIIKHVREHGKGLIKNHG